MPIRLEDLPRAPPTLIADDRSCTGCTYSLRGLRTDGLCPECGQPITPPKKPLLYTDQMSAAPLAWLARYKRGTTLLFLGGWGMAAGLLTWALFAHVAAVGFALAASLLWVAGTIISTHPRPKAAATKAPTSDPTLEWKHLRRWARLTQPAWPLALALATLTQALGQFTPATISIISALLLIGVAGWWPLMLLHSNLAYWASDTDLSEKLRNCSWASAPGMGIGAAVSGVIGGMTGGLAPRFLALGYFVAGLSMAVWVLLGLFALWYTLSALWDLMRLAHYAMAAHLNVQLRDQRLRERAQHAREAAGATHSPTAHYS
jgi:hypothetical protein